MSNYRFKLFIISRYRKSITKYPQFLGIKIENKIELDHQSHITYENNMQKILMSACLSGKMVRYDGETVPYSGTIFENWILTERVITICPEVYAGMSIPRAPSEIVNGDGYSVWAGTSLVVDNRGMDVTAYFKIGAQRALELCKQHNITIAVLTEKSPSCGSSKIYDGSFTGHKIEGVGVTTALLRKNDIKVLNQHDFTHTDNWASLTCKHAGYQCVKQ